MAPALDAAADYARASFAPGRSWREAMLDLTSRIKTDFAYDPKPTTVTTRVDEVLEHRRGVVIGGAHQTLAVAVSVLPV